MTRLALTIVFCVGLVSTAALVVGMSAWAVTAIERSLAAALD